MAWWLSKPDRWDREVREMTYWFPVSQWGEREMQGLTVRYWEIIVEPCPPLDEISLVLADLNRDGSVQVERGSRVRHHPRCHAEHRLKPELQGLNLVGDAFLVELVYREPPAHPLARCLEPKLSRGNLPGHQHFYNEDIVCPLFPPDGTWQWWRNTAADYMMHVVIWLLKTATWLATKPEFGNGIWVGAEVGHSIQRVLRTDPKDECPCGSGRKYRQCHIGQHLALKMQQDASSHKIGG